MTYYETATNGEIQAHGTIEDAIQYADANGCTIISEIGGAWEDWGKCAFCGDWFPSTELNPRGECWTCERAIKDHGYNK